MNTGDDLARKHCTPCEGCMPPATKGEAEILLRRVTDWKLTPDGKAIVKSFTFKNFAQALAFVNKVGAIAEGEGHHPDVGLHWGRVDISLTTHAIGGLSENDFILAAKIDQLS